MCRSCATRVVEMSPRNRKQQLWSFFCDWNPTTSLHGDWWRYRVVAGAERGEWLLVIIRLFHILSPAHSCLFSRSWSQLSTCAKFMVGASSFRWINPLGSRCKLDLRGRIPLHAACKCQSCISFKYLTGNNCTDWGRNWWLNKWDLIRIRWHKSAGEEGMNERDEWIKTERLEQGKGSELRWISPCRASGEKLSLAGGDSVRLIGLVFAPH